MVRNNNCKCMPTLCKKMHMDSCMRAYSTLQQLLCHGGYCELILSLAQTSCRLLFSARPTAHPLAGNPLCDVVHSRNPSKSLLARSRNPSKSTLAHDAVATAVLHKHHPIIRVGAGLIQFVYRSHLSAWCTCFCVPRVEAFEWLEEHVATCSSSTCTSTSLESVVDR